MFKSFVLIKSYVTSPAERLQWLQCNPVGQLWQSKSQAWVFIQWLTTLPKPIQTFCWIKRSFLWPETQVLLVEKSCSEILQDVSCCKKMTVKSWIRVGKRSSFRGTTDRNLIWKSWLYILLILTDKATTSTIHLTRCQSKTSPRKLFANQCILFTFCTVSQLFWN